MAWSASGYIDISTVGIDEHGYACGDVIFSGSWSVTVDDTPLKFGKEPSCPVPDDPYSFFSPSWGNYIDSSATHAFLKVTVNGQNRGTAFYKTYPYPDLGLGRVMPLSWSGSPDKYEPGSTVTVKYELVDIYGVQCHISRQFSDPYPRTGDVFETASVSFKICPEDDPCCCDPCCGDICCGSGSGGGGAGGGGGGGGDGNMSSGSPDI
jgi:hypothetical protein